MKRSRYSEEQIAFALRQAESGTPIVEVCRKMGIARVSVCTLAVDPGISNIIACSTGQVAHTTKVPWEDIRLLATLHHAIRIA